MDIFEDYIIENCRWNLKNPPSSESNKQDRSNGKDKAREAPEENLIASASDMDDQLGYSASTSYSASSPLPLEILREIRAGYQKKKIRFVLNNGLFSDLYIYTLERLKGWYQDFQQSQQFVYLKGEVAS